MKITFHGATHTVTGSMHQVDIAGKTYLLDCGLFQGRRQQARDINSKFAFDPSQISTVFLSHGHADHCGNLPNLVKQGFRGPIYCTPATAAITALMLMDSAKIQEEDAGYLRGKPPGTLKVDVTPLYTREHAEMTIKLFKTLPYNTPTKIDGLTAEYRDAGHTLGSAAMAIKENATGKVLVFTADVGRPNSPIIVDPVPFSHADVLISECTYGGRTHPPIDEVPNILARIINETVDAGGPVLMPAFALGRTQAIVQLLNTLRLQNKIPRWLPIYVDSPLANRLTEVYRDFPNLYDNETRAIIEPFDFPNLSYIGSPQESRNLNNLQHPMIVIASSGMCEAGRIQHHLKHHIAKPNTTVLLPGFQAEYTLGRKLQDHWETVTILGDIIPLRARVENLPGLSAHADGGELLHYCQPLLKNSPTLRTFLVHGEDPQALAHKATLESAGFPTVTIATRGDVLDV